MRVSRARLMLVVLLTACGGGAGFGPDGGLRLEVAVARPAIDVGDTTSAVITLENLSARPVTLSFASSCQILPYIGAQPGDEIVYPGGGHWFCATVITQLTLPPFATKTQSLLLRGGVTSPTSDGAIALPPGDYLIHATLASRAFPLSADPVTFTVR